MGTLLFRAGKLVMRAGKFVYTSCAACCRTGPPVPGYWKAIACVQPTYPDLCNEEQTPPPHPGPIYVIDSLRCGSRPILPGDVILVNGICYTVVAPHLPSLPPGTLVITSATCVGGCGDDRCFNPPFRSGFGLAKACHPDNPENPRPVYYFCRRDVTQCVFIQVGDDCYKLDPSAPIAVPGPNDIRLVPGANTFTSCCDCVPECEPCMIYDEDCSPSRGYTRSNFRSCQCGNSSDDNCTEQVTGRFDAWGGGVENGQANIHEITEITYSGPCRGTGAGTVTSHFRRFEVGVPDVDITSQGANRNVWDLCFGIAEDFGYLGSPPFCDSDPHSTVFWSNERTCTSVLFRLRSGIVNVEGFLINVQVTRNPIAQTIGCDGLCIGSASSSSFSTVATLLSLLQG